MFIVGVIAAGVAGTIGVIASSDHSDYSDYYNDYSDYSDYAEKERKSKQIELKAKERELAQLRKQLENECNEAYETIKSELEENISTKDINPRYYNIKEDEWRNKLKENIKIRLQLSLATDKDELREINLLLKKINEIQLNVKKDIKVNK